MERTHPLPCGGGRAPRGKADSAQEAVSCNVSKQLSRCYEHIQQDPVREKKAQLGNPKPTLLSAILAETRTMRRKSWRQSVLSEGAKAPRGQDMKGSTRRASRQDWEGPT